MYILNFWYPVSWITLCFLSPKLHLFFSQTYWHASAVWSQQNLEMNHVTASMQEHCFMINITIHKSLFLRRAKEWGEGSGKKTTEGHAPCVRECRWWWKGGFRSGNHQGEGVVEESAAMKENNNADGAHTRSICTIKAYSISLSSAYGSITA